MRAAKIWPDIRVCTTLLVKFHVCKPSYTVKKIWLSIIWEILVVLGDHRSFLLTVCPSTHLSPTQGPQYSYCS